MELKLNPQGESGVVFKDTFAECANKGNSR